MIVFSHVFEQIEKEKIRRKWKTIDEGKNIKNSFCGFTFIPIFFFSIDECVESDRAKKQNCQIRERIKRREKNFNMRTFCYWNRTMDTRFFWLLTDVCPSSRHHLWYRSCRFFLWNRNLSSFVRTISFSINRCDLPFNRGFYRKWWEIFFFSRFLSSTRSINPSSGKITVAQRKKNPSINYLYLTIRAPLFR